jgi:hypothetical protein
LVALLWRQLRKLTWIAIGNITPTAIPGSATVFVFGGSFITAFQVGRVSPGLASCMRHYGDGSDQRPDRM